MNAKETILSKKEYLKDYIVRFMVEITKMSNNKLNNAEIYTLIYNKEAFVPTLYQNKDIFEIINLYICFDYIFKNNEKLSVGKIKEINNLITKNIEYQVIQKNGTFFQEKFTTEDQELERIIEEYNSVNGDIYTKLTHLFCQVLLNKLLEKDTIKTLIMIINSELIVNGLYPVVLDKEEINTMVGYITTINKDRIARKIREKQEYEQSRCNSFM